MNSSVILFGMQSVWEHQQEMGVRAAEGSGIERVEKRVQGKGALYLNT